MSDLTAVPSESEWDKKEKNRSLLPGVQDLIFDLKKREYPDDILEIAEELAYEVGLHDAEKAKSIVKKTEDLTDTELEELHYEEVKKKASKKD